MNTPISPDVPSEILEQEATEQRRRIHASVSELRDQVRDTVREKLDLESHVRPHVWRVAGIAGLFSLAAGYGIAGLVKQVFS